MKKTEKKIEKRTKSKNSACCRLADPRRVSAKGSGGKAKNSCYLLLPTTLRGSQTQVGKIGLRRHVTKMGNCVDLKVCFLFL